MIQDVSDLMDGLVRRVAKERLVQAPAADSSVLLDRAGIERLIPHRDPFLLVDDVTCIDSEHGMIATHYALDRAAAVFAGHFPDRPIWPGVLQVEAIAQAGLVFCVMQAGAPHPVEPILTHVLSAQFIRPIIPGGSVEIAAQVIEDGLFYIVVGQCLYHNDICSAAAIKFSL